MRARYYAPALGRFASEDKALDGLSWFVYCEDSPANKVDASGNGVGGIALFEFPSLLGFLATMRDCAEKSMQFAIVARAHGQ